MEMMGERRKRKNDLTAEERINLLEEAVIEQGRVIGFLKENYAKVIEDIRELDKKQSGSVIELYNNQKIMDEKLKAIIDCAVNNVNVEVLQNG
jgi:SPX domain protein involved in polyphosphate accumulation